MEKQILAQYFFLFVIIFFRKLTLELTLTLSKAFILDGISVNNFELRQNILLWRWRCQFIWLTRTSLKAGMNTAEAD